MRRSSLQLSLASLLAILAVTWYPTLGVAAKRDISGNTRDLLAIGRIGEKPIDLKIEVRSSDGSSPVRGKPIVVRLKSSRKAYITAIYVSAKGDATIVYPAKTAQDNPVLPDKEYTLFGEDSGVSLRMSDKGRGGKIVFYVSSKPLLLDSLKSAAGSSLVTISRSSARDIEVLSRKLMEISKDAGFNRVLLKSSVRLGRTSLKLMGAPPGFGSTKPGGTSGVQGLKDQMRDLQKE